SLHTTAPPALYPLSLHDALPISIAINPGVFRNMPVDTQRDLIPVTLVAEVPSILVAHPGLAANNVAELVTLARSKPGELNFASRSEEHTSELQSRVDLVCRLLLE